MFLVVELQTYTDGTMACLTYVKQTLREAQSKYHEVLAAAALSGLPAHSAAILTKEARSLEYYGFVNDTEPAA